MIRTDAEWIADGIRETAKDFNAWLQRAREMGVEVHWRAYDEESMYWTFDQRGKVYVDRIQRTEIL